jgi:SnoaL-like domain
VSGAVEAISRLVFEYAERLDRGDLNGVGELFGHATYRAAVGQDVHVERGSDAVRSLLEAMVMIHEGTPSTKHLTTNLVVDVDEDRATAVARSCFAVLQARPELSLQVIVAGRYHDRFERADDGWRFADRLIYSDLVGDVSHHLRSSPY